MRLSPFRLAPIVAAFGLAAGAVEPLRTTTLVPDGGRRWRASNIAQHIQVVFTEDEMLVSPISPGRVAWNWGISLIRFGTPVDTGALGHPRLTAKDDRADYLRGPLVEWFRNAPTGIEHGLMIQIGNGASLLLIDFKLSGNLTPKVSEDGQTVGFRDSSGTLALRTVDLGGLDADGREVVAFWERIEHADDSGPVLRLVVHGADHAYPLQITQRIATPKGVSRSTTDSQPLTAMAVLSAPPNDLCGGANVIPGAGPFPYLSSDVDITDATTTGDPPAPSCQTDVSRSVWFALTPTTTAAYSFSVCSDAQTDTTVEDTVLAVYSATAPCAGLAEIGDGCDDDSCGPVALQSTVGNVTLMAGTTYYVVAWSYGSAMPLPGAGTLQLQVVQHAPPGPAPTNDRCDGAETIPGGGPFPYLTSVTSDIGGATTTGDPPVPSCQPNVSRSIWYSFTPTVSGRYTFSVCADAPAGSTVDDTVMALYTATGACSGFQESSGGCDDDSCGSEGAQSVITGSSLAAGTSYFIVVWEYGTTAPSAGSTAVQLRVTLGSSPSNDTCATAATLPLDTVAFGTSIAALDDTRLPTGSSCFAGIGQTPSTALGGDVAYRFTAPEAGRYSFRVSGYEPSKNVVLYVSSDCPTGAAPALVVNCLGAANRSSTSPEEVSCLPLAAHQTVYVYFDEASATSGSTFTLEATHCALESEPNGNPAAAGDLSCGTEGSIAPAGDADVFSLGIPESGSRVFAIVDGAAGNSTDFDLRVTTDADTLEYDDFNNDVPFGSAAPNVSGTRLNGAASFLRVSHYSPVAQAEPYRLSATVQPPSVRATQEVEPNNDIATATGGANEYYAGALSSAADVDFFSFAAIAGERVEIGLDLDPARDNTAFNGSLALVDGTGVTLLLVNDPALSSSNVAGTGSLSATTPYAPGEAMVTRIETGGTYFVRVAWSAGTPGDYLLSISHQCRINPPTDIAVTQSDTPDPVPPAGALSYSIVARNLGTHPASGVTMNDELPEGASLVSVVPSQGTCTAPGAVSCHLGSLEPGASATVNVVVTAPIAPGSITNSVRISTVVIDPVPANDSSSEQTVVSSIDGDGDGVPDAYDCAPLEPASWAVPGEATGLSFPSFTDKSLLEWTSPSAPGGTMVRFDLLRSTIAGDFQAAACRATDTTATSASDSGIPTAVFYYLVRAENSCGGRLGARSDGTPRSGRSCP